MRFLLAPDRVLALAAEIGLDLLRVDPVRGRDVLLEGANVVLELGGGERAELEPTPLVE